MAGVKGRSGGSRNPPGGRPSKNPQSKAGMSRDEEEFLRSLMADVSQDVRYRLDAAKALLAAKSRQVQNLKDQRQAMAAQVSSGRFASPATPKLTLVKSG